MSTKYRATSTDTDGAFLTQNGYFAKQEMSENILEHCYEYQTLLTTLDI